MGIRTMKATTARWKRRRSGSELLRLRRHRGYCTSPCASNELCARCAGLYILERAYPSRTTLPMFGHTNAFRYFSGCRVGFDPAPRSLNKREANDPPPYFFRLALGLPMPRPFFGGATGQLSPGCAAESARALLRRTDLLSELRSRTVRRAAPAG